MKESNPLNITVKNVEWQHHRRQLSNIRCKVFVDEQHVPVNIELDDQDSTAQHWLVYLPNGSEIGTARLTRSGQVGRMAVLKEYRGYGIGTALLRRIILDASHTGIHHLHLNAQIQALSFYEKLGFTAFGNQFQEAGITHIAMKLDINPFHH